MSAILRRDPAEQQRAAIDVPALLARLSAYALGDVDLSAAQVRSIEILLKKSIPDLQSVAPDGSSEHRVIAEIVFKGLNE